MIICLCWCFGFVLLCSRMFRFCYSWLIDSLDVDFGFICVATLFLDVDLCWLIWFLSELVFVGVLLIILFVIVLD